MKILFACREASGTGLLDQVVGTAGDDEVPLLGERFVLGLQSFKNLALPMTAR
jgi:hypothetical protein